MEVITYLYDPEVSVGLAEPVHPLLERNLHLLRGNVWGRLESAPRGCFPHVG
jgi:hypothetical protein